MLARAMILLVAAAMGTAHAAVSLPGAGAAVLYPPGARMEPAPDSPFTTGGNPMGVAVGDLNRDGIADVATANNASNDVTVLLGDGHGGFSEAPGSPFHGGPHPSSIAIGDLNRDNRPDLAIANYWTDGQLGDNTITVLLGDGRGGYTESPGSPFDAGTNPRAIATGQSARDKQPFIVTANAGTEAAGQSGGVDDGPNDVSVLLGDGRGGFRHAPGSPFPAGDRPFAVVVGDFTGDRRADIAVAGELSGDVTVLLGDGHGGFTHAPGSPFSADGSLITGMTVADVNGDGASDVITANDLSQSVSVLLGDGRGRFLPAPESPFPVAPTAGPVSATVADFNGDGASDVAVPGELSSDVTLLLGDGHGSFTRSEGLPFSLLPGVQPVQIASGDFDRDDRPDLVTVNYATGNASVLLNRFPTR